MTTSRRKKDRSVNGCNPRPQIVIDPNLPLSVQLPPLTGLARWKPVLDLFSVFGLFLSILILGISAQLSWLQFRHAQRQSQAADEALLRATRAQQLSQDAEAQIVIYTNLLAQLRTELIHTKELTELSRLTILAESGDREALKDLISRSKDRDWVITTIDEKNINRIWTRFQGVEISDLNLASRIQGFHTMTDSNAVVRFLNSPQFETRAEAVDTVRFLRLNFLIPLLIDIGVADPDLHVVQVVCNTLNEMLLSPNAKWELQENGASVMQPLTISDFVVTSGDAKARLLGIWENRKQRLLAVKPKFWQPKDGGRMDLIDPELENDIARTPNIVQ